MDVGRRTLMTLEPLLDSVSQQTSQTLIKGFEAYDFVRSRVMQHRDTSQQYASRLARTVPELNLRYYIKWRSKEFTSTQD